MTIAFVLIYVCVALFLLASAFDVTLTARKSVKIEKVAMYILAGILDISGILMIIGLIYRLIRN